MALCLSLNASSLFICKCKALSSSSSIDPRNHNAPHTLDTAYIRRVVVLADKSTGLTSLNPNFGCIITTSFGDIASEGSLYAQGTTPAEVQVMEAAGKRYRGATTYLNMEPGDCHGERTAVFSLVQVSLSTQSQICI